MLESVRYGNGSYQRITRFAEPQLDAYKEIIRYGGFFFEGVFGRQSPQAVLQAFPV